MDDILASIRRILNEDEPAGGGGAPSPPSPARPGAEEPAAEPIELTESMLVNPPAAPPRAEAPGPAEDPPRAEPPRAEPMREEPPAPVAAPPPDSLVAPAVAAATTAALGQLLRTVAAERQAPVNRGGGPSIEDVVREELRPLLKAWLDQHLPPLAERLVRAEIERVVGRAL
jgi:cell pole-organizing protein PopZ